MDSELKIDFVDAGFTFTGVGYFVRSFKSRGGFINRFSLIGLVLIAFLTITGLTIGLPKVFRMIFCGFWTTMTF